LRSFLISFIGTPNISFGMIEYKNENADAEVEEGEKEEFFSDVFVALSFLASDFFFSCNLDNVLLCVFKEIRSLERSN
jgi:hypothetical protein